MWPRTSNDAHAIAETITRLLNHFGATNEHPAVRKAIAEDWMEDLAEFTPNQVRWATREWRRTQTFRPKIAEIRNLATQAQHNELKAIEANPLKLNAEAQDQTERLQEIEAQEERYRRAAAYRAGKLDEYDAKWHPERLAERRKHQNPCPIADVVAKALDDLGITSQAAE